MEETFMKSSSFKTFMKKSGIKGVKDVALEYATENDFVTYDVLSKRHGITKDAVRCCIEYCIIYCIIETKDAIAAKNKAHRNQMSYMSRYAVRTKSDEFYDRIFRERLAYVESILGSKEELMSRRDEAKFKSKSYHDYVSSADINDGYSSQNTFDIQQEKLMKEIALLNELVI